MGLPRDIVSLLSPNTIYWLTMTFLQILARSILMLSSHYSPSQWRTQPQKTNIMNKWARSSMEIFPSIGSNLNLGHWAFFREMNVCIEWQSVKETEIDWWLYFAMGLDQAWKILKKLKRGSGDEARMRLKLKTTNHESAHESARSFGT